MSHTLAKIAALGGGTAAAGGGIAAGASALSGTSEPKQEKIATTSEKKEEIPAVPQEEETPPVKICNVYTAEEPTSQGQPKGRVFTQLKDQFWSKDDFLKKIKGDNAWNKDELTRQVEKGCQDHGSVYVWWGYGNPRSNGETWVYASDMNNGKDWLNDESVNVPAALKSKVATAQ